MIGALRTKYPCSLSSWFCQGKQHKGVSCRQKLTGMSGGRPGRASRGVQTFGISGPHWKKSCLRPHIKYTNTNKNWWAKKKKKKKKVLSKFTILCWAPFIAILGHVRPMDHGLDTPIPGPVHERCPHRDPLRNPLIHPQKSRSLD